LLHIATCPTMTATPVAEASPANRHHKRSKGRTFNCIRHYADRINIINMTFLDPTDYLDQRLFPG